MERKAVSGIKLTLLLISILTMAFSVSPVAASLPVHNIDTDEDFATIQEAIDDLDTVNGHTILVDSGTYYERVTIYKSISLVGGNKHSTIIDGNFTGSVVVITADNVNVSNFTIRNSARGFVFHKIHGVRMENCSGNTLSNNIIENTVSIRLYNSSDNTIADNEVFLSGLYWGAIVFFVADGNTFTNNTIRDGYIGILLAYSSHNVVNRNKLKSNFFGIRLMGSNNNTIVANEVYNNRWGVYIAQYSIPGENNLIYHNNFVNNSDVQAREWNSTNIWDNGYPFGGNYWSNYTGVDLYSGPYQNESGSDGIGDTPYFVPHLTNYSNYDYNQDSYPLMEPWSPPTMIKTLIRTIRFWNLHRGTENSLTSKLEDALRLLDMKRKSGAVHKLMAFINQVEALRGKKLTDEQADNLTSEAQRIIELIKD